MLRKTIELLTLVGIVFLIFSCSDDEDSTSPEPLVADFEISVNNDTAPAEVTITNNTTGATSYSWTFTGGSPESSTDENPSSITYSEAGEYTISLEASNGTDTESISKTFSLGESLAVDFEVSVNSETAPAEVTITNNTTGATSYNWTFTGGSPESSTDQNPSAITYSEAGEYTISLEASNGTDTESISKTFSLSEPIVADFEISIDSDIVPSEVTITNNTTGATSYSWTFTGGSPESSTDQNPSTITYTEAGEYTISLEASNGTDTESISKTFSLSTDEILSYENITLGGVNVESTVGSVFSTSSGTVIKSGEISDSNGSTIDIAFIGTSGLRFFESPDAVSGWGLTEIPNATTTAYINYIEGSSIEFSIDTFDNMSNDSALKDLDITNDSESFPSSGLPRIVLFENSAGKKGAIKITAIQTGSSGSITFDLKVQK